METTAPTRDEFGALLQGQLNQLPSARERTYIESRLVEPYQLTLHWEYGKDEPYQCWVFAEMGEREVVAVYCRGGHGALGSPWGINFRTAKHFGMDSGWYRDLGELLTDWSIE
jgi:hypothetical protein